MVDSFTNRKFFGNQAPVVIDADGLNDYEKVSIAKELNASETVFVSSSEVSNFKIQFFAPKGEIDICGHGTIAAYWVLCSIGRIKGSNGLVQITQETRLGVLPVDLFFKNSQIDKIMMHQIAPEFIGSPTDKKIIARILNISDDSIVDDYPIQNVSTGRAKLMIPVHSNAILERIKPDFESMIRFCKDIGTNGFHTFTFETKESTSVTASRHFAPTAGVNEDPVTGNAAGALGCYLIRFCEKIRKSNNYEFIMEQGASMGRDGRIFVQVSKKDDHLSVKVGGKAVIVYETHFCID